MFQSSATTTKTTTNDLSLSWAQHTAIFEHLYARALTYFSNSRDNIINIIPIITFQRCDGYENDKVEENDDKNKATNTSTTFECTAP